MSKHTNSRRFGAVISDATGLPLDMIGTNPIFQMYSDREMIIEGAEMLEYYDECCAKIRTGKMYISLYGKCLLIKCLANKNISVCGNITNIELEHI